MRLYHIVAISDKSGHKTYMTSSPLTHDEACTMLSKFTKYTGRSLRLEEL